MPKDIGQSLDRQAQYLNRSKPQLDSEAQAQLLDVYDAQTFGSVQVATEKLYVWVTC